MGGVTLVGRNFRKKTIRAMTTKLTQYVGGNPGLHADIFTFIKGDFIIKCQTSKLHVQGLFDRL